MAYVGVRVEPVRLGERRHGGEYALLGLRGRSAQMSADHGWVC